MENELIKGRAGTSIKISGEKIIIKKGIGKDESIILKSSITFVESKKSIYDIPFLEKTLVIRADGKTYKIKRLPAKSAEQLKSFLI
jgi:hypothetical protein